MMFLNEIQKLFPLRCPGDVIKLFRQHLEQTDDPDLTLLSIVTGMIEHTLCSKVPAVESSSSSSSSNSSASVTATATAAAAAAATTDTIINTQNTTISTSATNSSNTTTDNNIRNNTKAYTNFPVVNFDVVKELYDKFAKILSIVDVDGMTNVGITTTGSNIITNNNNNINNNNKTTINKSLRRHHTQNQQQTSQLPQSQSQQITRQYATREIIKKVSDIVWNSLIRTTYKDRAHLHSLYSYLAGSKLDCFGMALSVVAGCQMLGYRDVHLAISEDHAWVVFGPNGQDTVEVTWHGKGTEDKRGQSVVAGCESHSWLYLAGNPVVCTNRAMEVAAIISAINPSLNITSACLEMGELQQQLLWLLYDMEYLQKYPMGLGCLGELEEVSPTVERPSCEDLYAESVRSSRCHYRNHHVYPYTYQGAYYYRQNQYKDAFSAWANAGDVIRLYNYSKDDEEIYKEFLEIANELIPLVMKTESSGHSAKSVLRDPQCFANLLRFYDGICQWEEGSQTPILHIGWAKPLVSTISRFDGDIRSQVIINVAGDDEDVHSFAAKEEAKIAAESITTISELLNNTTTANNSSTTTESNNNIMEHNDEKLKILKDENNGAVISSLEELTAACGEKILNPDFLLQGGGQPFAESKQKKDKFNDENNYVVDDKDLTNKNNEDAKNKVPIVKLETINFTNGTNGTNNSDIPSSSLLSSTSSVSTTPATVGAQINNNNQSTINNTEAITNSNNTENIINNKTYVDLSKLTAQSVQLSPSNITGPTYEPPDDIIEPKRPEITLYSRKMKGIRDLLLTEKLNTHAISLQVTAQSQVQVGGKKNRSLSSSTINYAAKRSRRQ